jgi:signal transduction histidine kinase
MNEKIQELFEGKAKEIIKKTIGLLNVSKDKRVEVSVEHYYLDVRINIVNTLIEIQYILTIKDITPYKNMQSELSKRQTTLNYTNNLLEETIETLKESSKIGARGYVARELHDIIGHSLVVTIKLLEVAKVYFKKDKEMSLLATVDAYKSIENGILNMEAIQDRHNNEVQYSGESLRNELAKMLINVKNTGIKTKLHFKGVFHNISSDIHGVIEKVCMELLTNSIKHSRCNEIFISVTVGEDDINIMVMDNGIGVDQLTRGSGLTGIEERLGMLNGKVQFFTSKGEGFMSKIHISN